jgi:hypothetical protein
MGREDCQLTTHEIDPLGLGVGVEIRSPTDLEGGKHPPSIVVTGNYSSEAVVWWYTNEALFSDGRE